MAIVDEIQSLAGEQEVAEFIKRVVADGEKPHKVKLEVAKFTANIQKVKYCFL